MQARLQAVSGGEARLSIATITGKALRMSDVGEARKAKMTEKRATTAERRRTPQRAQTPKPRARNATEAANELEADVAVAYVAASHAALTALARADEDAYAFGCENTYRLQLVETPRRPFGDEAPPLRAQFRGLARVRRGFFARRRVLLGQLGQAKELLGLHRAELRALNLKRSRNAVARLLLMDELYYATDGADAAGAMRLVRASPAGLKAWRALLEVLAAPRGAGDLCGTRNELRDVAARGDSFGDEADDVRSMSDVPEARPTTASAVGGDAAAAQHLASWDALEALFRPEGGGEKREWCEVYRVETFLEDAAVGASVKDDARDAVAAFQLDPNGDAAGDGYPLHRLDAVNAALWDSMGKRFLHVFERSPLADDLLWSLRIARQAARRRPDDDGGADRKAAAAVRRDLMRERGGAVEEATSDGGVRTFAHDADYMDSTALHGVDSRVKLNVLEPLLRLQMGAALELRWTLSAEVAVQTQFIYEMAAPHVQRLARGVLARGFGGGYLEKLRARRILRGAFSAAVVVQGLYRRRRAYVSLLWARFSRFEDAATVLQCLVRAYFSRLAAVALKAARLEKRFIRALTRLQTFQRQRCALKAAKQRRRYLDVTTANAATTWAATAMQAQARAWLGRLATFRRRVELDVNQRILHLAHRYLKSGDLWSFVRAVDDDYRRFEEDARESQRREDEESHTFMKRVLQARDEDHAQAWKSFVDAGSVGGSAVSPKESLLPGPRLRLLLGGLSKSISDSESVPSKRTISTQRASYATARVGKADGDLNRILPGRPPASIARSVRHHHFSTDDASVKRPKDDASLPSALTAPTAGPVLRLADGHHPGRAMHPVSPRLDRAKPAGLTALLDVPKGLDDSLERLLCAAALRAYVPDAFPKGTLVKTAFEQYQALPPSLVKCRHEMEASAGAAPWVAALTAAGFRLIQDLLPQRRLRATLEALAPYVADAFRAAEEERQARVRYVVSFSRAPIKLKAICLAAKDLLDDLVDAKRQAGGAPFVFKNRNQVRYEKLVRDGMMTHHQVIDALRHQRIAHLPPLAPRAALHPLAKPKPPTLLLDSVLESSESVLESLESVAPEMASARSLVTIEEAAATSAKLPDRVQDDLAAQRLQEQFEASVLDDVRKLGGLKCPVDVFGCRAAFLAAELQPLGEFAADVLRCDAARARILVRDRTRLAMQLAAPLLEFAAENKLEFASDLGSVDLAEADWGNVGEQARQLLRSLANTNSAQLVDFEPRKSFEIGRKQDQFLKREAHFFKSEDQTSTFTKPLRARRPPALKQIPFDARFQKSPFDAKGRPARLSLAKTRPDGSKLSRFAAAPLPPSDFERSLPPPVFQKAPESEWVEAIHLLDAKKREVMSLHPDELKPLHLQPQKYAQFVNAPQVGRDAPHPTDDASAAQRGARCGPDAEAPPQAPERRLLASSLLASSSEPGLHVSFDEDAYGAPDLGSFLTWPSFEPQGPPFAAAPLLEAAAPAPARPVPRNARGPREAPRAGAARGPKRRGAARPKNGGGDLGRALQDRALQDREAELHQLRAQRAAERGMAQDEISALRLELARARQAPPRTVTAPRTEPPCGAPAAAAPRGDAGHARLQRPANGPTPLAAAPAAAQASASAAAQASPKPNRKPVAEPAPRGDGAPRPRAPPRSPAPPARATPRATPQPSPQRQGTPSVTFAPPHAIPRLDLADTALAEPAGAPTTPASRTSSRTSSVVGERHASSDGSFALFDDAIETKSVVYTPEVGHGSLATSDARRFLRSAQAHSRSNALEWLQARAAAAHQSRVHGFMGVIHRQRSLQQFDTVRPLGKLGTLSSASKYERDCAEEQRRGALDWLRARARRASAPPRMPPALADLESWSSLPVDVASLGSQDSSMRSFQDVHGSWGSFRVVQEENPKALDENALDEKALDEKALDDGAPGPSLDTVPSRQNPPDAGGGAAPPSDADDGAAPPSDVGGGAAIRSRRPSSLSSPPPESQPPNSARSRAAYSITPPATPLASARREAQKWLADAARRSLSSAPRSLSSAGGPARAPASAPAA